MRKLLPIINLLLILNCQAQVKVTATYLNQIQFSDEFSDISNFSKFRFKYCLTDDSLFLIRSVGKLEKKIIYYHCNPVKDSILSSGRQLNVGMSESENIIDFIRFESNFIILTSLHIHVLNVNLELVHSQENKLSFTHADIVSDGIILHHSHSKNEKRNLLLKKYVLTELGQLEETQDAFKNQSPCDPFEIDVFSKYVASNNKDLVAIYPSFSESQILLLNSNLSVIDTISFRSLLCTFENNKLMDQVCESIRNYSKRPTQKNFDHYLAFTKLFTQIENMTFIDSNHLLITTFHAGDSSSGYYREVVCRIDKGNMKFGKLNHVFHNSDFSNNERKLSKHEFLLRPSMSNKNLEFNKRLSVKEEYVGPGELKFELMNFASYRLLLSKNVGLRSTKTYPDIQSLIVTKINLE